MCRHVKEEEVENSSCIVNSSNGAVQFALHINAGGIKYANKQHKHGACSYMRRLPGADMDLSSLLLGHSKGLLKERFLSMALTKI